MDVPSARLKRRGTIWVVINTQLKSISDGVCVGSPSVPMEMAACTSGKASLMVKGTHRYTGIHRNTYIQTKPFPGKTLHMLNNNNSKPFTASISAEVVEESGYRTSWSAVQIFD